jgi:peptidoglycan/xylan/chitin deacetylase (PgdA/CDA1 family)
MDWHSLRDLDPDLVEIGAHSRTHPILAHCSTERVREEIAGSKAAIERELGRTVRTFGYPNGTPADVDARCFDAVRAAGYESAVLSRGALIRRGMDPHALPRMSAFGTWDFFVGEVSGFSHLVPALIPARVG